MGCYRVGRRLSKASMIASAVCHVLDPFVDARSVDPMPSSGLHRVLALRPVAAHRTSKTSIFFTPAIAEDLKRVESQVVSSYQIFNSLGVCSGACPALLIYRQVRYRTSTAGRGGDRGAEGSGDSRWKSRECNPISQTNRRYTRLSSVQPCHHD